MFPNTGETSDTIKSKQTVRVWIRIVKCEIVCVRNSSLDKDNLSFTNFSSSLNREGNLRKFESTQK